MSVPDNPASSTDETPITLTETNKYALVVGVNNSRASTYLPDLKYAEEDAEDISWSLRQPACQFKLVSPVLTGNNAETKNVRSAVIELAKKKADQDFVLFYFIGHAQPMMTKEGYRDIYFVTNDFSENEVEEDPESHLSMRWLRKRLYQPDGAASVFIILDCCYAGDMIHAGTDPARIHLDLDLRQVVNEFFDGPSIRQQNERLRVILTATRYHTPAKERVMTRLILSALQGNMREALDLKGNVNVHSLYTFLQDQMPQAQLPNLSGDFPRACILASHPEKSHYYLQQTQEAEEKEIKNELSKIKEIITDPNYFVRRTGIDHTHPFDQEICEEASFSDLDLEKITEFFEKDLVQRQKDFRLGLNHQDQLHSMSLWKQSLPMYGTLLSFGENPSKWIAGAFTRCIYWKGQDRYKGWTDDQEYRGCLLKQYESSCNFLKKCLRFSRVISRDGSSEQWEIPFRVLEETLTNALIHREYANPSTFVHRTDCVHVDVFSDRIEISSPGEPPPPMTLEMLGVENECHPRNPQIVRIFYLYGYVEKVGSGIQRIQRLMKEVGLPAPELKLSKTKTFKVIIYRPKRFSEEVLELTNTEVNASNALQNQFDASFYINTFIRQYENWDLRYKEEGIVEPVFRNKLFGVYVPLCCEDEKRESSFKFDEFMQRWLTDAERHNLVLLGEYGSGKTSSCLALCYRLLLQYRDRNDSILPVYLNFRNISLADESDSPEKKIFTFLSEKYQFKMGEFSESDFKSTLRNHKFLLILDGLDEIVNSLETEKIKHQFSRLKNVLLHCHKVIITCRTNYFHSEADVKYVFPLSSENVELLDNIVGSINFELLYLSDLGEKQQEEYLQNSIKDEQRRAQILATIHNTVNLSDLARRPILLSMIVTFDDLLRKRTDIITQTTLYHEYTLYWLRRDFEDRSHRPGTPNIPVQMRLFVLERLALNLFEKGTEQIHHDDLVYFLSEAFEGRDINSDFINYVEIEFTVNSFLIRTKDNYFGFAHRSFLEFFVARALRQDILANKPESFGQQRLFGLIATFLTELIEQEERQQEIKERLIEWMMLSRSPQNSGPYLGGNSATLLCRLDFSFKELNLSHVIFKYADLSEGDFRNCTLHDANLDSSILTGTNFSGSDLQDADLRNTFVKETLFRQSNLQGTSFKNIRLIGGPNTIWKAAFTPDRLHIAVGTDHGDLVVLPFSPEGKGSKEVKTFPIHETGILHFAFSPNGELIAIADRGRSIHLYSWSKLIAGEEQQSRIFSDNADYVRWLEFSPKGDILVSGGRDQLVKLWYLEEPSQVKELKFHTNAIMYTTWAPTGQMIASGGYDHNVCLWYINGKNASHLPLFETGMKTSHTDIVRALAFNKDGTMLASSAEDNTIKLWSLSNPRRPKFMDKIPFAPTDGHIFCLAFVEEDKTLLTGDSDGYVSRIDVPHKQLTQKIRAHEDMLRSFSLDEASGLLLTASWDGTVKLWHLADLSPIGDDNVLFRLDREEFLYRPKDAFQGANIKGIRHLSQSFKRCFINLGAIEG